MATAKERIIGVINPPANRLSVLDELIQIQTDTLKGFLNGLDVPAELEYVVVETTIARYRRLGSEGMDSENIDVISKTFSEDIWSPYFSHINKYLKSQEEFKKPFKLL